MSLISLRKATLPKKLSPSMQPYIMEETSFIFGVYIFKEGNKLMLEILKIICLFFLFPSLSVSLLASLYSFSLPRLSLCVSLCVTVCDHVLLEG